MVKRKSDVAENSPSAKKGTKTAKKPKIVDESEEEAESSGSEEVEQPKPKSSSKGKVKNASKSTNNDPKILMSSEGEKYVDLGKKKRTTVRSFKGKTFIDIREFYGDDGNEKPGKKGISLSPEQWEALKDSMSTIDDLVSQQG
ncbi:hypothetical protein D9758_001817 [Tetrapyrgos nigripes]|uniref:Transcriptional coactivator p15 (PC4) C-terminal domain-containing protein n=1 Tax=Tetrapyrgos nigripes TaxID=182062 RepID=A0A8H5GTH2_9AGAR|nr:hypothetical protein D9758_001817 [Tetrapyrgos nigripes]